MVRTAATRLAVAMADRATHAISDHLCRRFI
jgi:hypothetical protein